MHLYIQNAKTTHFRCDGNGWFRACWGSRPKPWRTKTVLGNDPFRIGCSIKNRFEERVCSQKVYSKNRKSRDKSTVNFGRLTAVAMIDTILSNILSIIGF